MPSKAALVYRRAAVIYKAGKVLFLMIVGSNEGPALIQRLHEYFPGDDGIQGQLGLPQTYHESRFALVDTNLGPRINSKGGQPVKTFMEAGGQERYPRPLAQLQF